MSDTAWFSDALLINRDPNWYGHLAKEKSAEQITADLRSFFVKFTEHAVTDVQLCVFENTSIIPSEAVMWRGLKYLQTEENGHAVDYSSMEGLYRAFTALAVDPVQIFIDTMRAGGVRPWITLRMNDAHFGDDETSFLRDDFFYTAERDGMMIGDAYGYYAHCLNYSCAPVRARMLAYIEELLARYDIFGLELDFMREIHSFDYRNDPDRHAVMNDFIASVRAMLVRAGERVGHPVRLMVRLPRSIEDAYAFGFDVAAWVRRGLIDAVVPTPRWECSDDGIPVAAWKALVGEDIAVFPGIEILHLQFSLDQPEIARAYSAAWNTQGADGLYFNNHDYATPHHVRFYDLHRDTVLSGSRRYIVTFQDICAHGNTPYRPLPMTVDGSAEMRFCIGPVRKEDRLTVIAEWDGACAPTLTCAGQMLAGVRCEPAPAQREEDGSPMQLTGENTFAYAADGVVTDAALSLVWQGSGVLTYLEFRIEPKI